ncbi:TOM1-like protein 2 isoform X1 [Anopheles merus]|uniref:TOM1-like protein 2 isoform X1 n=1 Tax=Anopheles merus TaxID=30066 RepID=UPI001BE48C35|nr:TOM1-like protein 2 isoform X1 [Anopheles merus]XP_041768083.1 TOM1-like protein 2 isoform X1 [Anopheles merus]XP_041768084.1 TOM1-like protein 2 isoform X1 [Anopheles merus]XP_041768085.1 TOM1-like protein 2 isoform X1 [Anopheles merus]XP_041768086.1 TOM1-like protein 2 isoform X1 [Anopheles merus]XP_041768087.1 TOM1-like protein 2 isoform X1 [Anopheles merus]XP_041768088.1 TOM1-like protein 2 isoform X1 [Anopheles merus]
MTSFFNVGALGGNPFSTPVGQKVEQATDASLASENWALNMEICDMINESSDGARDAMKAIRKRLAQNAGKNYTVIMYTLTVLETCVKNCGKAFHVLVANKEFIQELVKLIGPKNDPPPIVQEKVLSLIQIWADAFRSQPDLNGVVQVYQELKNKGIEFPATDLDAIAPIYTPQRSVPDGAPATESANTLPVSPHHHHASQTPGSPAMPPPSSMSQDQIAKLQSELDIVAMNMSILGEMLTELKPGQEDAADYKLLTDLTSTCREMQNRIVDLIGKVQHDELTAELLRLNDELNNLFLRHARYEKNRDPKNASSATPSAILGAALGAVEMRDPSLIDLSEEPGATGGAAGHNVSTQLAGLSLAAAGSTATASSQLAQLTSVTAQSGSSIGGAKSPNRATTAGAPAGSNIPPDVVSDEFDMFAQSRNTTGDKEPSHRLDALGAPAGANTAALGTRESEFDEIEQWLGNPDDIDNLEAQMAAAGAMGGGDGGAGHGAGTEESLTSKEFEKFLAERAAVAETLPTISSSSTTSSSPATTAKDRKKKSDETDGLLAL